MHTLGAGGGENIESGRGALLTSNLVCMCITFSFVLLLIADQHDITIVKIKIKWCSPLALALYPGLMQTKN